MARMLVVALLALAVAFPAAAQATTGTSTFSTPGEHAFVVPAGVTSLRATLVGGAGGRGMNNGIAGVPRSSGGAGGREAATLAVAPGQTLFVEVASNGGDGTFGGPGGGGTGGGAVGGLELGGGGGGATDVRTASSLASRLLVAGGGGGGGGSGSAASTVVGGDGGPAGGDGALGGCGAGCDPAGGGGGKGLPTGGGTAGASSSGTAAGAGLPGSGGAGGVETGTNPDGGGGGGGAGIFGGGGGGGGFCHPNSSICSAGGGGGGGASGAPAGAQGVSSVDPPTVVALSTPASATLTWTLPPPAATTASPTDVASAGATLRATVNPNGSQVTDCHFELSNGAQVPCAQQVGSGSSPLSVSAPVSGLSGGTGYAVRIVATSTEGTTTGSFVDFMTVAGGSGGSSGGGGGNLAPPNLGPPSLTNLRESSNRWRRGRAVAVATRAERKRRVGTTLSFTLDQPASVQFVFTRATRKRKGKKKRKTAKPAGTLTVNGHAGPNSLAFQGVLAAGKKLPVGRYTLTATATNAAGLSSSPASLSFKIVRR